MLGLKLIHVSKRGQRRLEQNTDIKRTTLIMETLYWPLIHRGVVFSAHKMTVTWSFEFSLVLAGANCWEKTKTKQNKTKVKLPAIWDRNNLTIKYLGAVLIKKNGALQNIWIPATICTMGIPVPERQNWYQNSGRCNKLTSSIRNKYTHKTQCQTDISVFISLLISLFIWHVFTKNTLMCYKMWFNGIPHKPVDMNIQLTPSK